MAASGLPGVVHYFVDVAKQQPLPIVNPTKIEVVAVIAEGDYVTVMTVRHLLDAKSNPYTHHPGSTPGGSWMEKPTNIGIRRRMPRSRDHDIIKATGRKNEKDIQNLAATIALAFAQASNVHAQETLTAQTVIDKAEIDNLLERYYANFGKGGNEDFAALYTEDAEMDLGTKAYKGRDAIVGMYKGVGIRRPKARRPSSILSTFW